MSVIQLDDTSMTNITFEDIRVERAQGRLVNIFFTHELFNIPGECKAGGTIRGVTFRNISAPDWPFPPSEIEGPTRSTWWRNVTFTNLRIQGQPIRDAGAAGLLLRHARNVRFDP